MQQLTFFFWFCSGADLAILEKCPTERSKYVGIGAPSSRWDIALEYDVEAGEDEDSEEE